MKVSAPLVAASFCARDAVGAPRWAVEFLGIGLVAQRGSPAAEVVGSVHVMVSVTHGSSSRTPRRACCDIFCRHPCRMIVANSRYAPMTGRTTTHDRASGGDSAPCVPVSARKKRHMHAPWTAPRRRGMICGGRNARPVPQLHAHHLLPGP